MKIGFAGTHSGGKTSQLEGLSRALKLPALSEVVRDVAAEWGITNVAQVPDRARFQWEVLHRQMAGENAAGGFVSDRTTVDNCAYFLRYVAPELPDAEVDEYIATAKRHADTYDHIVFFPIMWDGCEDDGFRGTDPAEREQIEWLIRQLLHDWGLWHKVKMVTTDDAVMGPGSRSEEIAGWFAGESAMLSSWVY